MGKTRSQRKKFGTMRYRRPVPLLLCFALLSLPIQLLATVEFVVSPLSSRSKNIRLFEAADTRVMLPTGYARDPSAAASMVLRPGTVDARVYTKPNPDGGVLSLELALVRGITAGGGIHLTGVRRDPHQCSAADRHGRFAPGRSRLVGCPRRLGGSGGSFLGRRLAMRSWKRIGSWATASSSPR